MPSIEEQIEDLAKRELDKYRVEYYGKTQVLTNEIKEALKKSSQQRWWQW
ncbi:hypothetical protein ACIXJQ_15800 [Bacteroides fragilis]